MLEIRYYLCYAKLRIFLLFCLCTLTSGQVLPRDCHYDQSYIVSPSGNRSFSVNITGQRCRARVINSISICFLPAEANFATINYRLVTNLTAVLSSPPTFPGFSTSIRLFRSSSDQCCSTSIIENSDLVAFFEVIIFIFGSTKQKEYLMNNIQSLELSVGRFVNATIGIPTTEEVAITDSTTLNTCEPVTSLPNDTEEPSDNRLDQLVTYITVPLSLLLVVGFLIPCLYLMIQSKRKKNQLLLGKVYFEGGSRSVNFSNGDPSKPSSTLDPHYSYIEQDEIHNYSLPPQCSDYIPPSLPYASVKNNLVDESIFNIPESSEEALYDQLGDIFIDHLNRGSINILGKLGSGQFGNVYKGVWSSPRGDMEVAIKTLKEGSKEEDRVKFLQEAAIMGQFQHSSIVTMHGIVTEGQPILMVLELLSKGDLRNHLISSRTESDNDVMNDHTLLSYCRQVVFGMNYLANKNFVHRDLAARNILVSDDETCKIADFGMSRELLYQDTYTSHGGMIPVKWTAPEALFFKTYSTASDVWSYGILLYEIWSMGHKPYEELKNNEVLSLLKSGRRLAPPPGCPRAIYSIMINCWHSEPSKRPTFEALCQTLTTSDPKLLKWSERDKMVHPKATVLGADLSSAMNLYSDLQQTYHELSDLTV